MPDFRDDLLQRTAATRQRPAWSFPEGWLPMTAVTAGRRTIRTVPWKTVALLALLVLLLTAAAVLFAGSQPRPAPMLGRAANGLVAYETDGDIYTVDPADGSRRAVITGETQDHSPHFSLDGMRMLFLRGDGNLDVPVIAMRTGGTRVVTNTPASRISSPDSIVWSPDGRTVALLAAVAGVSTIHLIDAVDGTITVPSSTTRRRDQLAPARGRAFMFTQGSEYDERLVELLAGHRQGRRPCTRRPRAETSAARVGRPMALVSRTYAGGLQTVGTYVIDLASGRATALAVGYGELSNDGRRVVGIRDDGDADVPVRRASRRWACARDQRALRRAHGAGTTAGRPMTPRSSRPVRRWPSSSSIRTEAPSDAARLDGGRRRVLAAARACTSVGWRRLGGRTRAARPPTGTCASSSAAA